MSTLRSLFAATLAVVVGTSAFGAPILLSFTSAGSAAGPVNTLTNTSGGPVGTLLLQETDGSASGVTITGTAGSAGSGGAPTSGNAPAAGSAADLAGITSAAGQSNHFSSGAAVVSYTFSGLSALTAYDFDIYSSRSQNDVRATQFTLSNGLLSAVGAINSAGPGGGNNSDLVSLGLVSNAAGELILSYSNVNPNGAGTRFGYINAVRITEVPEPASLTLLGVGGICLLGRRRNRG